MATLANLNFNLTVRTREFDRNLRGAENTVRRFQRNVTQQFRRIATAAAAGTAAFAALSRQSIQTADNLAKSARNAGITAGRFQELAIVFELNGSNQQALVKGSQALARAINELRDGTSTYVDEFAKLNLATEDFQGLGLADSILLVTSRLREETDEVTRLAVAQTLAGRAGKEFGSIINGNSESIAAQIERVRSLGITIEEGLLGTAEEANDNLFLLGESIQNNFTNVVLRAIRDAAGLQNVDQLIRRVGEITRTFTQTVIDLGQAFIKFGPIIAGAIAGWGSVAALAGLGRAITGIKSLTTAIFGLNLATRLNPIVALITAIAAIGTTVITWRFFGGGDSEFNDSEQARIRAAGDSAVEGRNFGTGRGAAATRTRARREAEEAERQAIRAERNRITDTGGNGGSGGGGGNTVQGTAGAALQIQLQDRIRSFNRFLQDESGLLTEREQEQLELRRRAEDLELEAERTRADATDQTREAAEAYATELERQAGILRMTASRVTSFNRRLSDTFDELTVSISDALAEGRFQDLGSLVIGTLTSSIQEAASDSLQKVLDGIFDQIFASVGQGSSGGGVGGFIAGLFRADGGPVSGGNPYIVGERGPELFVPGQSGMVVPNEELGGNTFNFNITGNVDEATQRVIRQMAPEIASSTQAQFVERGVLR